MENNELLTKIARAKVKLCKMMRELEKQSDIKFGYTEKEPIIYIYSGVGDVSRITDQFMCANESGIDDYPLEFTCEHEGVKFISLSGDRYGMPV